MWPTYCQAKKPTVPYCVILKNRHIKSIIISNKKQFAPRAPNVGEKQGAFLYPIYEDVTRDSYQLMKKLRADSRVQACWFAGGAIRFITTNSDTVKRVSSIFGPYEDIFA